MVAHPPMGVAVPDASGNPKAFASEDGVGMFRFDIARQGLGSGRFLPQAGTVVITDAAGQCHG